MAWTLFWDMHSGGGLKEEPYDKIYIEAPEEEAIKIFYNLFGHNPHRVSCTCCGDDYSVSESETFEKASGYHRGCDYAYFRPDGTECPEKEGFVSGKGTPKGYTQGYVERKSRKKYSEKYVTVEDYMKHPNVLVIPADDIKPNEKIGDVPEQGYVWQD